MKLEVLWNDNDYVIINKPSGLLSISDRFDATIPSAYHELLKQFPGLLVTHRIDRDTSGCLSFAKHPQAHQFLNRLLEQRKVHKVYHAWVHGSLATPSGFIKDPIMEHPAKNGKMMVHQKQGKEAITEYQVLEDFGKFSYVACTLHTGRTHQIRLHLSNIGNPIIGDAMYGLTNPVFVSSLKRNYHLSKLAEEEKPLLNRLALHAFSFSFQKEDGTQVSAEAPLPKDMQAMLKQCLKWMR
ncbi:MAG: RluA family pseudouridine synthase [Chitinophagaceae bacterium]|nr:RluA family pseudouridine synthase [Chitinophagaceae bacterium]